jgi:hypothetical protein
MKSTIFWDVTRGSPVEVGLRFGETYCLHVKGRRVSQAYNQQVGGSSQNYSPPPPLVRCFKTLSESHTVALSGTVIDER